MSNFPDFSRYGYQVEAELGHNRAGGRVTYLATQLKTSEKVVIKQFQFARTGSNWTEYDAYDREIQTLSGLQHSGIPKYLDSLQTEDGFCMVQEYKRARPLSEPRSFAHHEVRKIAVETLEILAYLQTRVPPIIHRDIKPENILVDDDINVYLVDFGFARIGDGEVGVSSVVKGTLGFMPPEQLFNRQLTEASDLYGLGITLICLLTNTKSNDIGNLIDISYRVNFKPLVPKLSLRWVNWLEKMVESRLKDRFPNAAAALAALPEELILPDVVLSQSSLNFVATRIGERPTQTITISNPVPQTGLEGRWEVAPHPSDPPHTPDQHDWILVEPAEFAANRTECQITINTHKLMANKTYTRTLLLHTNALPKTYSLNCQIRTAPLPIRQQKLPYDLLLLLFPFSLAIAWILASVITVAGTMTGSPTAVMIGAATGSVFGFEIVAWMLATAGSPAGATSAVISGVMIGVFTFFMAIATTLSTVGARSALLTGVLAGGLGSMLVGGVTGIVVESLVKRGIRPIYTVWMTLLTTMTAISLGFGLTVDFANPLVWLALGGNGIPLSAMLIYLPLHRTRLTADYRRAEQRLIKP